MRHAARAETNSPSYAHVDHNAIPLAHSQDGLILAPLQKQVPFPLACTLYAGKPQANVCNDPAAALGVAATASDWRSSINTSLTWA